jgi:hypothetical protein
MKDVLKMIKLVIYSLCLILSDADGQQPGNPVEGPTADLYKLAETISKGYCIKISQLSFSMIEPICERAMRFF